MPLPRHAPATVAPLQPVDGRAGAKLTDHELRQRAFLDIESSGGSDALLCFPLSAEERGAAATSTSELPGSEEKADIHQSSAQHEFYERLGECDGRALGLVIADLLRLSTPRNRPEWVARQLQAWLQALSYFQCKPRQPSLHEVCLVASVRSARAGEPIARQGSIEPEFHVLLAGACSVHLNTLRPPSSRWRPADSDSEGEEAHQGLVASGAATSLLAKSILGNPELNGCVDGAPPSPSHVASRLPIGGQHATENTTQVTKQSVTKQSAEHANIAPTGAGASTPTGAGKSDGRAGSPVDDKASGRNIDPHLLTKAHGEVIQILHPGDAFGEMSCLLSSACGGSLVANSACELLVLRRKRVLDLYGSIPTLSERIRFLRGHHLHLPPRQALSFRMESVEKGVAIVRFGQPLQRLVFVYSGSVSVRAPRQNIAPATSEAASPRKALLSSNPGLAGNLDGPLDLDVHEISIVCAGGCLGDELLLESNRGSLDGRARQRPGLVGERIPRATIAAEFDAVAREDTRLLVISRHEVSRLSMKTLAAFSHAAMERHTHRIELQDFRLGSEAEPAAVDTRKQGTMELDTLLVPLKVLTMGRDAATDANVSRRMARRHRQERWGMQKTLELRTKQITDTNDDLPNAQPVRRIPKFRHLADASLRSIVSDVRPPDQTEFLQGLHRDAQQATLMAAKTTSLPPCTSTFAQLRRWRLEHSLAGDRFSMKDSFFRPSNELGANRPGSMPSLGRQGQHARNRLPRSSNASLGEGERATASTASDWLQF